jgi:hypothetical protein
VTVREQGRGAAGPYGSIAITLDPVSESVAAGATASFSAAAAGGPTPTVQWQVSTDAGASWSDISGATFASYSFTASAADNGNRYRALFTSNATTALSAAATLTVSAAPAASPPPPQATSPRVTQQPAALSVTPGSAASFTAAASGSPTPGVQWQVSTDSGMSWSDITGATAASYAFTASAAEDGNQFRAVFSNSAGTAVSSPATLTLQTVPQVEQQPADAVLVAGTSASFTASASGFPTPTVQWQVSTDAGASWSNISGASAPTYTLSNAAAADNGNRYRAVFTNAAGTATSDAATLTVEEIPQIEQQPADAVLVAGMSASFTASASGIPTPTVQWQVSTDAGASWSNISGATAPTYTVSNAAAADNGNQYRAVFANAAGTTPTGHATLTVDTGPEITRQPAAQSVAVGVSASFTASASGVPPPTVQWQLSTSSGVSWSNIVGATADTYTVPNTDGADDGNEYRAVFANAQGTASTSAATLNVLPAQPSANWSGYVDTGATFSAVSAGWVVPSMTCALTPNASLVVWVGIDGGTAGNATVEQDGIEADCGVNGSPTYFAWYEMYGDEGVNSGNQVRLATSTHPVSAGDVISASVSVAADLTWTLQLQDQPAQGAAWTFAIPISPPALTPAQASAEWIVERPNFCGGMGCSPAALSDFGTVTFTAATATGDGTPGPINAFSTSLTEMTGTSGVLAAPGPLDPSDDTFTDTWYASN